MKMIDQLSATEVLALARFLEACRRLRGSLKWRTQFYECARRGSLVPYVTKTDATYLARMVSAHGAIVVCLITTGEVLRAAQAEAVGGRCSG